MDNGKKVCRRCKEEELISEFSKDITRVDGLHPYCKACRRKIGAPYKRRKREDKEYREKDYATHKRYYWRNREALTKKMRERDEDFFATNVTSL